MMDLDFLGIMLRRTLRRGLCRRCGRVRLRPFGCENKMGIDGCWFLSIAGVWMGDVSVAPTSVDVFQVMAYTVLCSSIDGVHEVERF